jgi:hypothetical protein
LTRTKIPSRQEKLSCFFFSEGKTSRHCPGPV